MRYEVIDRPQATYQHTRQIDEELYRDLVATATNGKAILIEWDFPGRSPGSGGMAGKAYRDGYTIHERRKAGRYIVWMTRGMGQCGTCQEVFDMVSRAEAGLKRLGRNDPCPEPFCGGRVKIPRNLGLVQ